MITAICAALLLACAPAVMAAGEWLHVDKRVCFGETREGRKLYMNVYEPPEKKALMPACISIHGGSWKEGDADSNAGFSVFLARHGMMVFDIDYRLTTEARWPAQIEDCKTAVRFVRSSCRKYDIDPGRIMAAGGSAGAHLACMLAVLPQGKYEGAGLTEVSSSV
ncbi:MAG: alpha/beta hydrolase [Abditibacteriota bacterium]|nr:alpha/beta hydrolase [Abditibacteriota bacterium]